MVDYKAGNGPAEESGLFKVFVEEKGGLVHFLLVLNLKGGNIV